MQRIEFLTEKQYIQINFNSDSVQFWIIETQGEKITIKTANINLKQSRQLSNFENIEFLHQLLRNNKNFEYIDGGNEIIIKWKMIGECFQKQINYHVDLQEEAINQKQKLELEIKILKLQLANAELLRKKQNQSLTQQINKLSTNLKSKESKVQQKKKQETIIPTQKPINKRFTKELNMLTNNFYQRKKIKVQDETKKTEPKKVELKYPSRNKPVYLGRPGVIQIVAQSSSIQIEEKKNSNAGFSINQKSKVTANQNSIRNKNFQEKLPKIENETINLSRRTQRKTQTGDYKTKKISKQLSKDQKEILLNKVKSDIVKTKIQKSSKPIRQEKNMIQSKIFVGGDIVRIDFPNGDYYTGQLLNNKCHGKGVYYSKQNGFYDGEFKNGLYQGYGKLEDINKVIYEGYFKQGTKKGKGIQIYINQQKYEGEFENDEKNGFGTYYFQNNDKYIGQWKDNKYHGQGRQQFADGDIYEGSYKEDEKDGQGVLKTKSGKILKQNWNEGKLVSEFQIEEQDESLEEEKVKEFEQ